MIKIENNFLQRNLASVVVLILFIYLTRLHSYILFHSMAEMMSIVITFGVYMIAWNTKLFTHNKYFIYLGIAFFWIALLDLLHTFTYRGLGIFNLGLDTNIPTQLWIAARYMQSISFFIATFYIGRKLKVYRLGLIYGIITTLIIASIFWIPIFPTSYIEGEGMTIFKKFSELVICFIYVGAILRLYSKKKSFNIHVFHLLIGVLSLSILSEFMFMIYSGVYDTANLVGHLLKILSFSLIYIALVETQLQHPYSILFRELKDSENNYRLSEQKFRKIFNNATVGIFMTDMALNFLEVNQNFLRKIGYTLEELQNLPKESLNQLINNVNSDREFLKVISGERNYYEFENCYLKKDGTILWGNTSISLIYNKNDGQHYILWVIKDITQIKELELLKVEFVSLASHQLRTPLTSVRLASELLLRGIGGFVEPRQRRYVEEIQASTIVMTDMIKDLLNVSRADLGTFTIKPEPTDILKHVNQIIEESTLQIKAKNIILSKNFTENLPIVRFDSQILRMIFENLLTNAINYTPIDGLITVKVYEKNNAVHLAIRDTGCGIPADEQDKIFNKMYRAKNAREINPTGTGLGLYIAKSFAEKAGGNVWFESEEGVGSTFFVSLPIA